jgi:glycosyltransferase involved in cell wall biosynthesis
MPDPLLTVVMPSYNYAKYLRQAIETILNQSFSDFEFLIIDDESSDESPAILKEYMKQDKRIRAVFHPRNQGMVCSYNEGTTLAKGRYIHYLAADDFRYPGFLQECMDVLLNHPHLALCCTQFHWGNEEKLSLETCGFASGEGILFLDPKNVAEYFLKLNFKVFAVSAILKKELVQHYGGFDAQLYYLHDWYLVNEIVFNHPMALITEPLSRFRIHDSNFSNVYRHNKKTKMAAYRHLLAKLDQKENRFYREQIRKSALLSSVFQDLFWKLLVNPKYFSFWPYINQKYPIKERIKKSLKKKLQL